MTPAVAIETIASTLRSEPRIRALFLSGSRGAGLEDAYSDIDFVLVASDGPTEAVVGLWREAVGRTGEILLWWHQKFRPALVNAIVGDWLRIDAVILKPEQIGRQTKDALKIVFDHDRLFDALPASMEKAEPDLRQARHQIEEFIRILGLLPLVMGRQEHLNGVLGIFHLRNLLVDLLIEETGAPHRGGALHLNRLITDEQQALLVALPPAIPTRNELIAAHLVYATAYLPRARRLAERQGVAWPERFEAATWERLQSSLSIERPYDPN